MSIPFITDVNQLLFPEAIRYLSSLLAPNIYFTEAAITLIRTLSYKTVIIVDSFNEGLSLQNWLNSGYFQPVTRRNIIQRLSGIIEIHTMKIIIIQEFLTELINFTIGKVQHYNDNVALFWDVFEGISDDQELSSFFNFDGKKTLPTTFLINFQNELKESTILVKRDFVCGAILAFKLLDINYNIRVLEIPLDITEIMRTTRFLKPSYPNAYSAVINNQYYYFETSDFITGIIEVCKFVNYDSSLLISDFRKI